MNALQIIHFLAGLVVLAEALNKLERCDPLAPGLALHDRVVDGLKAVAWLLLCLSAGGAVASPVLQALGFPPGAVDTLMRIDRPTLSETCALLGFAVLIVRTRVKEG